MFKIERKFVEGQDIVISKFVGFRHFFKKKDPMAAFNEKLELQKGLLDKIVKTPMPKETLTDLMYTLKSGHIYYPHTVLNAHKFGACKNLVAQFQKDYPGKKLVIFLRTGMLISTLGCVLRDFGAVSIYGHSLKRVIAKKANWFEKQDWCQVMIKSYDKADVDLTVASHVMILEPEYDLGLTRMALEEWRGKELNITILTIKDTFDDYVTEIIEQELAWHFNSPKGV